MPPFSRPRTSRTSCARTSSGCSATSAKMLAVTSLVRPSPSRPRRPDRPAPSRSVRHSRPRPASSARWAARASTSPASPRPSIATPKTRPPASPVSRARICPRPAWLPAPIRSRPMAFNRRRSPVLQRPAAPAASRRMRCSSTAVLSGATLTRLKSRQLLPVAAVGAKRVWLAIGRATCRSSVLVTRAD